jgi:hypothetical protein
LSGFRPFDGTLTERAAAPMFNPERRKLAEA